MNMKQNLPSRPATATPGFAGGGITATPRFGFGRAFAWLLLAFALLAPAAHAAPGDVDPLNLNIVGSQGLATAVQPDGKTIIAGTFTSVLGQPHTNIARLNADGTLDAGFNPSANNQVFSVAVQPDGQILLGGSFTTVGGTARNRIARLNADGTLDAGFNPNPNSSVYSVAVQADGQILLGGQFTTVGGTALNRIARVAANGTLDAGFNPDVNNVVYSVAVQADGQILLGGNFSTVGGTGRNFFARLVNDPATQSLTIPSASRVQWLRGGASPEVEPVTYELSTDGGTIYSALGAGTRIAGGWERTGLTLPASGHIRARGRTSGGYFNGSGGLVETVAAFSLANPEIAVASPLGVNIVDGGLQNFGSVSIGVTGSLTFTITNSGVDPLNLTGSPKVALAGANAGDFTVSLQPTSPVATNGTTTFTVQFSPQGGGARTASLSIANDDADENPFDLVLTGTGFGPEIAVEQPAGTDLTSGTSSVSFGTATVGVPVVRTFTVKNTGVVALSLGAVSFSGANASNFTANTTGMPAFLSAGDQTTFTVTFAPSSAGAASATLSLVNSDTSGGEAPFLIALTGTGYVPQPEIAVEQPAGTNLVSGPATVAFGTAATGAAAVKTFTVKNTGDAALTLGAITFTGANAGDFTVTTPPVSPVAATNGSTTFTVTFRPGLAGARSATLNIANDDTTGSEAPFLIALTGTGSDSSQVASYGSPGSVTGGWVNGGNFTIGTVGTANPANNWPAAESPDKATDGDVNTKFLLFQGGNAGLILSPANASLAYNRLALTTANDAPERDPASYIIFGSTNALTTSSGANIPTNSLKVIASGTLTLPAARITGPTVVQFSNTTAYASYVVVFPTVKNVPASTLMQIAEVKLSQGMNAPNAIAMSTARGGQLVLGTFTFGTVGTANPGNNWPTAQSPDNALDGDVFANFLLFQNTGMGLIASPAGGASVVNRLSFWTAGDAPERDPITYAVYGFNTPVTQTNGTLAVGAAIATGTLTLPTNRAAGPVTVSFVNNTAYASYLVVFPSVRSTAGNNITQIGEVQFGYVSPTTAPLLGGSQFTEITSTSMSFTADVTSDGGAPITERGVVYSIESVNLAPLIGGFGVTKVTTTGTTGVLAMTLPGLTPGTLYTFRAYAINSVGTSYNGLRPFGPPATAPLVSLPTSSDIFDTSATLGGTVTSDGGSAITERGVVYSLTSTNPNPLISGIGVTKVTATGTTGMFTAFVANLTASSGYSFKAYAINGVGTTYTTPVSTFTTAVTITAPAISSPTSAGITATSATLGGNVTSDGGSAIIERGVVYSLTSTNANPLIGDPGVTKVTTTGTTGIFTVPVIGLTPSSGYSFKAYAISSGGEYSAYTSVATFSTLASSVLYAEDSIRNRGTSGTGWASSWTVPLGIAPGLTYPGLSTDGGSVSAMPPTFRTLSTPQTTGIVWVSALVTGPSYANIGFYSGGQEKLTAGAIFNGSGPGPFYGTFEVTGAGQRFDYSTVPVDGATHLILMAINLDLNQFFMWVDPNLAALGAPAITRTASATTGSYDFDRIRLEVTAAARVDEVRAGSDLASIVNYVPPVNNAPYDIVVSPASIAENNAPGATVGTVNALDADAEDTHTVALVAGVGDTDNAAFTLTGNVLSINASADFETKSSYSVRLRVTEVGAGGLTFEAAKTISIANVTLPQTITFDALGGKTFGDAPFTVSATGGASGQPVTFSITSGPATISGDTVTLTGAGSVTVRASQAGSVVGDFGAATPVNRTFTVTQAVQTISFSLPTTALTNDTVTLTATGGASGNAVTFSVFSGPGSITGNALTFTGAGSVVVRAAQAGNANYFAAANVDRTILVNTAPVAVDHCDGAISGTPAIIPAVKLLAGATDVDGDPLTLTNVSALSTNGGTVAITGTNVTYTPVGGFIGTDAFTYTVGDGRGGSASATVVMNVLDATLPLLNRVQVTRGSNAPLVRFVGLPCHDYTLLRSLVPQGPFTPLLAFTAPASGLIEHLDTTPLTNIVTVTSYTDTNSVTHTYTNTPYSSVFFRMVTQP